MSSKKFHEVIQEICGNVVIPLDERDAQDSALLQVVSHVAKDVCVFLRENPIISNRPNEVGNRIEPHVRDFFNHIPGYRASVPLGKIAGYPDILVEEGTDRYTYIECKTYNARSLGSTFRSFYFSGSESFKVAHDARHLVVGFEIIEVVETKYRPVGFKIVDACNLPCTLKQEWNSNNKLLYSLPILSQYKETNG